jgi:hypothetical protein
MFSPQRLNVLLSRARNALIMIGNATTFMKAKKGKDLWNTLFGLLNEGGHMYDGLPVKCERHQDRRANLVRPALISTIHLLTAIILQKEPHHFDIECPNGGCTEPWYVVKGMPLMLPHQSCFSGMELSCKLHKCPLKCHQIADHSKMPCEEPVYSKCDKGHDNSYLCYKGPSPLCAICAKEKKLAEKLQKELFTLKHKQDLDQREHDRKMAELDDMIKTERQNIRDAQLAQERDDALRQKMKDLEETRALADAAKASSTLGSSLLSSFKSIFTPDSGPSNNAPPTTPMISAAPKSQTQTAQSSQSPQPTKPGTNISSTSSTPDEWKLKVSKAKEEWERQKRIEGASNSAIDAIMEMTGLESVKEKVLRIKDKIDTSKRQNASLKDERFNVVLLGNPGTGAPFHIGNANRPTELMTISFRKNHHCKAICQILDICGCTSRK